MSKKGDGVDASEVEVDIATEEPPMISFVNTKSGGRKGSKLLEPLTKVFGEERTYDLFAQQPVGPGVGLDAHIREPGLRVLVAGGDGTVNWVMEVIASRIQQDPSLQWPAIAILPLGTGNDLSRQFYWGHAYLGYDLNRLRNAMAVAPVRKLDRWTLKVQAEVHVPEEVAAGNGKQTPEEAEAHAQAQARQAEEASFSKTFINYFGIGVGGHVVSLFEGCRQAHAWLYCCRCMNNTIYGWFGMTYCCRCPQKLAQHYELEIDGHPVDIPALSQGLEVLNIQNFMGGVELWRHPDLPATPADDKVSICSVNGPIHLGRIKLNVPYSAADHVGQGTEVLIKCPNKTKAGGIRAQVDGEAITLRSPGTYSISKLPQASMLEGPFTAPPKCDFCC
jgi:diacylglycerol kinase (ATP)